jgi:flagellar M-ring protein FliF
MDFINKAWTQIVDVFKGLTPGTRIAVGLLAAAVAVGLFYLFQYQASGSDEYLLGGRPFVAQELTKAEAAFATAGLTTWEVVEGSRIRVPRGKKSQYLAALGDSNALPADFFKYLDEAAASDNPFSSSKSLDFKQSNAKQKELALIISRMRGIASATVLYDDAVKGGPRGEKTRTAMVTVKPVAGALDSDQVKAIRSIVQGAYAGLDKNSISIIDTENGQTYGGLGVEGKGGGENSLHASYKRDYEQDFQKKIRDQLAFIQNAIVNVNVELSPEMQTTTQEVKLDTKPVAIESSESNVEKTSKGGGTGGRPGAVTNGVAPGNNSRELTAEASGPESTTTESMSKQKNQPGYTVTGTTKPGLVPTNVTASISIPASHFVRVWKEQNPAVAGQPVKEPDAAQIAQIKQSELKMVEDIVRQLLPPAVVGTNQYPQITVASYVEIPSTPIAAPTFAAQALDFLGESWRTIGMIAVGLVSLVMLRGMIRSAAPVPTSGAERAESPRLAVHEEEEEEEPPVESVLRRKFDASGPNLKQELQLLVKEDPDAAAAILRNWIGDAA